MNFRNPVERGAQGRRMGDAAADTATDTTLVDVSDRIRPQWIL